MNNETKTYRDLMTEVEAIEYLRIPEISKAKNLKHVIYNLKRMHDIPCIYISRQPLYPLKAVQEWINRQAIRRR